MNRDMIPVLIEIAVIILIVILGRIVYKVFKEDRERYLEDKAKYTHSYPYEPEVKK